MVDPASDAEREEGAVLFVVGPFTSWPPPHHSMVASGQFDAGHWTLWATPNRTLVGVVRFHRRGLTCIVESYPLTYVGSYAAMLGMTWSPDAQKLYADGVLVGSTVAADHVPAGMSIGETKRWLSVDLSKQNREMQRQRTEWANSLAPRKGRRKVSLGEAIRDLADAQSQLADMLKSFRRGDTYFASSLAALLRSLLSMPTKSMNPLLQRAAGLLDLPLIIYAKATGPSKIPARDSVRIFMQTHVLPTHEEATDSAMDLAYWLQLPTTLTRDRAYTNDETIRAIADTRGSHFDPSLEPLVDDLRAIMKGLSNYGPVTMYNDFLLSVARVADSLSSRVITAFHARR